MSGGVDSSVAAVLLKQAGHEVVGCFMRLGSPGETLDAPIAAAACAARPARIGHQGCCSINDSEDARLVAAQLDIPFYVVNFKRDFGRIIAYFADEYDAGRTPNPCVRCNDWLKFGRLREYAAQLGCDAVATGHYAQITTNHSGQSRLTRGVDRAKDQSYVLFGTGKDAVQRMLLPIGGMEKPRVRELAQEHGLRVFDKPDSQEICFVPQDYASFLEGRRATPFAEGAILNEAGEELGRHAGHQRFTIGQRRGISVPTTAAVSIPLYVIEKDAHRNTVVVGPREALDVHAVHATDCVWYDSPPTSWTTVEAQVRAHGRPIPARMRATAEGELEVQFGEAESGVAPGQAVVCYTHGACGEEQIVAGGWIQSTTRTPCKSE
ncbi:MAG: tRNA 2-thiouridine(34) synthase MnmA [Phycisphaerales bacterium]|nr:tRNA 2-thiouridine(34) synthase MnmA [Phycisphaerales bacterium]